MIYWAIIFCTNYLFIHKKGFSSGWKHCDVSSCYSTAIMISSTVHTAWLYLILSPVLLWWGLLSSPATSKSEFITRYCWTSWKTLKQQENKPIQLHSLSSAPLGYGWTTNLLRICKLWIKDINKLQCFGTNKNKSKQDLVSSVKLQLK